MDISSFIKNGIRSDLVTLWDNEGGFTSEEALVRWALWAGLEDEWSELCCRESFVAYVIAFWNDHCED